MQKIYTVTGSGIKNVSIGGDIGWTYTSGGPTDERAELWHVVAFLGRAIGLISDAVATYPFDIMRGEQVIDSTAEWKNAVGFLPSPGKFLNLVEMSLCIYGAAYGLKMTQEAQVQGFSVGGVDVKPFNVKKMNNLRYAAYSTMTPNFNTTTGVLESFTRSVKNTATTQIKLQPDAVVYFWEPDPDVENSPPTFSRLDGAKTAARLIKEYNSMIAEFSASGGVTPHILAMSGLPTPAEQERIKSAWTRFTQQWRKVTSSFVMDRDRMDVKPVGGGPSELKNNQVVEQARTDIMTAYGIPPAVMLSDAQTYDNMAQSLRQMYLNAVIPAFDFVAETMNEQVFDAMGYRMVGKPERLEFMNTDEIAAASAFATFVSSGVARSTAARWVGIEMVNGETYEDLDKTPAAQPAQPEQTPVTQDETVTDEAEAKAARRRDFIARMSKSEPEEPRLYPFFEGYWNEDDRVKKILSSWERKALNALDRGHPAAVAFADDTIPAEVRAEIETGLKACESKAQVRALFGRVSDAAPVDRLDGGEIKSLLEGIRLGVEALKAQSYSPPDAARSNARRGLELREKWGRGGLSTQEAGEQGIGSGVARASNLANGDAVTAETVRKMRAFFSRHEQNKDGKDDDGGPSAGAIAWLLWGGDAARSWAESVKLPGEE